jgi:thymidylate synthase
MNNFDPQYFRVMKRVMHEGIDRPDRTGIGSRAIWGDTLTIDLAEGFPAPSHRKVPLRYAFEEIMWMLRGDTDSKYLEEQGINIWKGNTSKEFLDQRGLAYLPEGHIGKSYSFQWRNFGGHYKNWYDYPESVVWINSDGQKMISPGISIYDTLPKSELKYDFYENDNRGVDQVRELLHGLKHDPNGRRHIITGWNPAQLNEMSLPPCHLYQQYQVLDGKLNSTFVMRSWDFTFGAPFNIMGYAILNHVFAKYLGLQPGKLFAVGMDVHIYNNQMKMVNEILEREDWGWYDLPTLEIKKDLNTIDDIMNLKYSDIKLHNYKAYDDIKDKPAMAI